MKRTILLLLSVALIASAFAGVMTASAVTRVEPFLLLEGDDLLPNRDRYTVSWGVSNCSGELDGEGIARLLAHGRDPYYHLLAKDTEVRPIMSIKYRADIPGGADGKIYASAVGGVREGHSFDLGYFCNNEWQLLVVDMALMLPNGVYNSTRHVLNHLRFDFLDDGAAEDLVFEVEYIAFFDTESDAYTYDVQRYLPEEEFTTVATEETTELTPAVPETHTEAAQEESTVNVESESEEQTTQTEDTDKTADETGCKAVMVSAAVLAIVSLAVGVLVRKKRD